MKKNLTTSSQYFFCTDNFDRRLRKHDRAYVEQVNLFVEHLQITPIMLTMSLNPNIQLNWQEYKEKGIVRPEIPMLNLYEDLMGISDGRNHPAAQINYDSSWQVIEVDNTRTPHQRIRHPNGEMRMYIVWRDAERTTPNYINYFYNRRKIQRDKFNVFGQLAVTQYLGDKERILKEDCYTPQGHRCLSRTFSQSGQITLIQWFNPNTGRYTCFDSEKELVSAWLKQRFSAQTNNIFITDNRQDWAPALNSIGWPVLFFVPEQTVAQWKKALHAKNQQISASHLRSNQIKPTEKSATLIWCGDINLARRQHYKTAEIGIKNILKIPALANADYRAVNLECVISNMGEQGFDKGGGGPYYYRARPEMVDVLLAADIDLVTTANNHAGDYGTQALLQQKQLLNSVGIESIGSGKDLEQALQPAIVTLNDINVALISIDFTEKRFAATKSKAGTAYFAPGDTSSLKKHLGKVIQQARKKAHLVLVAAHFGNNFQPKPTTNDIELARSIIDLGADALLGSSAHVLQGIEVYKNKPIIYDAGDFLFDSKRKTPEDGAAFKLFMTRRGITAIEFIPVGVGFAQSIQLQSHEARHVTQKYMKQCHELGTSLKITKDGTGYLTLLTPNKQQNNKQLPIFTPQKKAQRYEQSFELPAHCTVEQIPQQAVIQPITLGPLMLLGVKATPNRFTHREMLWVESFWQLIEKTDEDYRIYFMAEPLEKTEMPPWGIGMDHDPCDWLLPTSKWEKGKIYRDYYGLRPPQYREWENIPLQLTVGLVSYQNKTKRISLPIRFELDYQPKLEDKLKPGCYQTEFPQGIFKKSIADDHTWNAEQLAVITKGKWLTPPPEGWFVRSVVMGQSFIKDAATPILFIGHDSHDRARHEQSNRTITKNFDRHNVLPALTNQLNGAIVSRPVKELPKNFPQLLVKDPVRCYIELGLAARARFKKSVIAITGTVGKSTTTDMLQYLLNNLGFKTLATADNYNSRVGAPGALASLSPSYDAAIVEIAQSALWMRRGPITRLIKPTISILTAVGLSQIGPGNRSTQDVAKWKSRVFDGLTGSKIAIICRNIPHFNWVLEQAEKHAKKIFVFGTTSDCNVRIDSEQLGLDQIKICLTFRNETVDTFIGGSGQGFALNAGAAFAAAIALGFSPADIALALQNYSPLSARMSIKKIKVKGGVFTMIDDSFNTEYLSVVNALSILKDQPSEGRKIALLGRIVHLGELAKTTHQNLLDPIMHSGAQIVLTHGEEMKYLREVLPANMLGPHFDTAQAAASFLKDFIQRNDLLLIKGSGLYSDFGEIAELLEKQLINA